MTPARIQLSRAKGFRLQAASLALNGLPAVSVARPSRWGNPFVSSEDNGESSVRLANGLVWLPDSWWTTEGVVGMYEAWMRGRPLRDCETEDWLPTGVIASLPERPDVSLLRGKNLACWCRGGPCHADVLLRLAANRAT